MKFRPVFGTIRAVLKPHSPYVVHFFVTERCNLKCSYCSVWRNPMPELDTEGQMKIIKAISDLGASGISFTGGEPLLRKDINDLLNFSSDLGMFTRVTSNGLMPRSYYERLLATRLDAFSISIDGLGVSEAPLRKIDPRIQENIMFLSEHHGKKTMNLCCVLHSANINQVKELVEWVASKLPGIRIFIQPVVTGSGKFRRDDEERLRNVDVLFELSRDYPDVVDNLGFFNQCAAEAAKSDMYHWGCRAGTFFFDIKPSGDFWICQDIPTPLNILDPEFIKKWRAFDPQLLIDVCPGCTYSCYLEMQKGFELKNIMAGLKKALRISLMGFLAWPRVITIIFNVDVNNLVSCYLS